MTGIDKRDFEYAVNKIDNGNVFEEFASSYLAKIRGDNFIPAGGLKDRGIDGLEHIFTCHGFERTIYQSSIEKDTIGKLRRSLQKLEKNEVSFNQFYFVTNQVVKNQDKLTDKLYDDFKIPVHIRDLKWLSAHVNDNQGTVNTYHTFVSSYMHRFIQGKNSFIVGNFINDPRLFVFLRQQFDHDLENQQLDTIVADSLILFALEGTDPDINRFKTRKEIMETIESKILFDPISLQGIIENRLKFLSAKPRKIKHHRNIDAYCLPYETRVEIDQRSIADARLHTAFQDQSKKMLNKQLKNFDVRVSDCLTLMESAFNNIYYHQGLEFADFLLKGENQDAFEKNLEDTISTVVDDSHVVAKNRESVKSALMITIREIVYNGTPEQKSFLMRLSNTYLMMFLLQCDPSVSTFFSSMASKLNIYVCTSILIPAMSEYYLSPENRRHWNLLKRAQNSGVSLVVNETIIKELVSHFKLFKNKYNELYLYDEQIYLEDETQTLYIDDIMIRAYFYAKRRGNVDRFNDFIDNFVSPNLRKAETEFQTWLRVEFGIKFVSDESLRVKIDPEEEKSLYYELKKLKSSPAKAKADTNLILTIYAIRKKQNEASDSDILGYHTWWLSKDTLTMRAVNDVFKNKYKVSCYMRPDFLYNYISLAPNVSTIKRSYRSMFPTLLGVNISYHLPQDIINCVHRSMKEHKNKNKARRASILRTLADDLRTNPKCKNRAHVKHFLDEKLGQLN